MNINQSELELKNSYKDKRNNQVFEAQHRVTILLRQLVFYTNIKKSLPMCIISIILSILRATSPMSIILVKDESSERYLKPQGRFCIKWGL